MTPILSKNDWNDIFPPEEEPQRPSYQKLAFAMVHERSDSYLIGSIKGAKQRAMEEPCSEYHLTPLHLAVMRGRVVAVEEMTSWDIDLNPKDLFGWTPLHHAAFVCDAIAQFLLDVGANVNARTNLGATFDDLNTLSGKKMHPQSPLIVWPFGKKSGVVPEEVFCSFFGFKAYAQEPVYPERNLFALWRQPENPSPYHQCQLMGYESFTNALPLLAAKEVSQRVFGLITRQPIQRGEAVIEYSGLVEEPSHRSLLHFLNGLWKGIPDPEHYHHCSVNAAEVGNVSRLIRDGWPNVSLIRVANCRGAPYRLYHLAIVALKADDELQWLYPGRSFLKWGHYPIPQNHSAEKFLQKKSISDWLSLYESVLKKEKNFGNFVTAEGLWARLAYCINSPAIVIYLAVSGCVDPIDWIDLVSCEDSHRQFIEDPHYYEMFSELLELLDNFHSAMKNLSGDDHDDIVNFLLVILNAQTVMHTISAISKIERWLHEGKNEEWSKVKKSMVAFLPLDWREDPSNFVLYMKRLKGFPSEGNCLPTDGVPSNTRVR